MIYKEVHSWVIRNLKFSNWYFIIDPAYPHQISKTKWTHMPYPHLKRDFVIFSYLLYSVYVLTWPVWSECIFWVHVLCWGMTDTSGTDNVQKKLPQNLELSLCFVTQADKPEDIRRNRRIIANLEWKGKDEQIGGMYPTMGQWFASTLNIWRNDKQNT